MNSIKFLVLLAIFLVQGNHASGQLPSIVGNVRDSIFTAYVNVDFKVVIRLNKIDPSLIEIKSVESYQHKQNDSTFMIRCNAVKDETKIKLYYKNLPIDIMTVQVKNIELADIKLGENTDHNILRQDLSSIKKFEFIYPLEFPKELKPELFSCKLTVFDPSKPNNFFANLSGYDIPNNVQSVISKLGKDCKIVFDEIRIKTIYNSVLYLDGSSIVFTIVE